MKMDQSHAESALGFDAVRAFLQGHLLSALGEDALSRMTMADTLEEVRTRLGRVAELRRILQLRQGVPMDDFIDIRDPLTRLIPDGAYVSGGELWEIARACRAMRRLRDWFTGVEYPLLRCVVARITTLRPLERHIEAMVDAGGEVRTGASAELARIRSALRHTREMLHTRLRDVLRLARRRGYAADLQPTVRGGRMVVPIRVEAKRKVEGFIHGSSATGQTVYIEPAACLALNNEVRLLEAQERREIERILLVVAARIREHMDVLRVNLDCLGFFDLLQALARLAIRLHAVTPKLSRSGAVDIREGHNPALLLHFGVPEAVVPFDMQLGERVRTLVISGPNAGGKTVIMKALGLLSVMVAYGIPVPVHPDSTLCLFDRLMVEIGDNQSIAQNLSTFSARMKGLGAMIDSAEPGTLILVDEIGTGTDPAEGAALAQAALEKLTQLGASTVVTTHHGTLKAFAHNAPGIENGSMEFDRNSLEPTFRFRQGLPGPSYAFRVAERLAFDPEVLEQARMVLGSAPLALESLLDAVQQERKVLAAKLQALDGRLARSQVQRHPRSAELGKVRKKPPQQATKKRPGTAREYRVPEFLEVGVRVVLDGGSSEGEVVAVEGAQVTVAFGSVRAKVDAMRLHPAPRRPVAQPRTHSSPLDVRTVADVRGYRVRDALRVVEKLIDNAVRANIGAVRIVHGKGTGALREAIHAQLARFAAVKEFSSPEVNPGITYVRFT